MREIIFRAWDDEYKLMLYPKAHYVSTWEFNTQEVKDKAWLYYNIWELYNPESNEYVSISSYKLTTMQYTWLKDKNWKEIYFEDYVLYKNTVYRVVWNKYKISLENISQKYISDLTEVIISDLSVLWNTYENEFNIIKQYKEI